MRSAQENKEIITMPKSELSAKKAGPESGFGSFIRIVKWQGRLIVLLAVALGVTAYVKASNIALPKQDAVTTPPPITTDSLQYNTFAYSGNRVLKQGDTVSSSKLMVMGQIYDYNEVKQKWPELALTLNGASLPVTENGSYSVNLNLRPGDNTIETALSVNGQTYEVKQIDINYALPQLTLTATVTSTDSNKKP